MNENPRYSLADFSDIEPVKCPCGQSRRAFLDDPDKTASMHVIQSHGDARTHYHKTLTEMYYVLEGEGQMELDGALFDVKPGSAVLIKPMCRHRLIGNFTFINVPVPAFDPQDEWFD